MSKRNKYIYIRRILYHDRIVYHSNIIYVGVHRHMQHIRKYDIMSCHKNNIFSSLKELCTTYIFYAYVEETKTPLRTYFILHCIAYLMIVYLF